METQSEYLCTCQLCGMQSKLINWRHLKKAHNMTSKEYRAMFPDARMFILTPEEESRRQSSLAIANKSAERGAKISKAKKGVKPSAAAIQKMKETKAREDRRTVAERNRANLFGRNFDKEPNVPVCYGVPGVRADIGIFTRSKMEANTARLLTLFHVSFAYEPTTFTVVVDGLERGYTPDFKIGNAYLEVKGRWNKAALNKFHCFKEQYPHVNIKVLDYLTYKKLEKRYKHKIPTWE